MKAYDQILMNLPEKFTRSRFIDQVATETAYSYSHAQNLLDSAVHEGRITRIKRGVYKKCEPELELEGA